MSDPLTKDIFPCVPVTAYKKDRNLSDHLVRASHPRTTLSNLPGTFPCKRSRCNTCKYVTKDNLTLITGPHNSIQVKDYFTCTTSNVVYIIICKKCKILYVGETQRRLADRITEHLRSIRINSDGFPVAKHFNPPSTCNINDFCVTGVFACRGSQQDRKDCEHRLIFKLGTIQPNGLNFKFDSF